MAFSLFLASILVTSAALSTHSCNLPPQTSSPLQTLSKTQRKRIERKRLKALEISRRAQALKLKQLELEGGQGCGVKGVGRGNPDFMRPGGAGKAARARLVRKGEVDVGSKSDHRSAGGAPLALEAGSVTAAIEEAEARARREGIGQEARKRLTTDVHGSMISDEEKARQGERLVMLALSLSLSLFCS